MTFVCFCSITYCKWLFHKDAWFDFWVFIRWYPYPLAEFSSMRPMAMDSLTSFWPHGTSYYIHPRKLTWHLKIDPWKRRFLLETSNFRFHVSFRGCRGNSNFLLTSHFGPWCSNFCRIYAGCYVSLFWRKAGFLWEKNVTLNSEQQKGTKQNRCLFLTCARSKRRSTHNRTTLVEFVWKLPLDLQPNLTIVCSFWLHHHWWFLDGGVFRFQPKKKEKSQQIV